MINCQSAVLSIAAGFGAQQLWAFLLSAGNQPSSQWQNYSLIGLTAIGSHLMIRSHFYQVGYYRYMYKLFKIIKISDRNGPVNRKKSDRCRKMVKIGQNRPKILFFRPK
jgi:hypothetical protein